jgi:signal peptidase I
LTFLSPGLGFLYHGRPVEAFVINAAYLLGFAGAMVTIIYFDVLPLFPLFVVLIGGLVVTKYLSQLLNSSVSREYTLKPYNHWLIYSLFFIFTYFLPIGGGLTYVLTNQIALERVQSSAMYPSLKPGDVVLIDRQSYRETTPDAGDVVVIRTPESGQIQPLRVVGVPGDTVQLKGPSLYIDEEPTERADIDPDKKLEGNAPMNPEYIDKFHLKFEKNDSAVYPIALSPRVISALETDPTRLKSGQYYLLADNRSLVSLEDASQRIRDSRHFGPLSKDRILGRVRFVAWSSSPGSKLPRPSRIGLRLR